MENEQLGNEAFMEVTAMKMDSLNKRVSELENQVKDTPGTDAGLEEIKQLLQANKAILESLNFPTKEIQELDNRLKMTGSFLGIPRKDTVLHHHHVQKSVWIITGLSMMLAGVVAWLFVVLSRVNGYEAADIKYRFLKMKSSASLSQYIFGVDSLYRSGYHMRDSVIKWEREESAILDMEKQLSDGKMQEDQLKAKFYELLKNRRSRKVLD